MPSIPTSVSVATDIPNDPNIGCFLSCAQSALLAQTLVQRSGTKSCNGHALSVDRIERADRITKGDESL